MTGGGGAFFLQEQELKHVRLNLRLLRPYFSVSIRTKASNISKGLVLVIKGGIYLCRHEFHGVSKLNTISILFN